MNGVSIRSSSQTSCAPTILRGRRPPTFAGAKLPVARKRCDHFTTLEGATSSAAATWRTLCPDATRAIARARKSIDIARVIPNDSTLAKTTVNHLRPETGIPLPIPNHLIPL